MITNIIMNREREYLSFENYNKNQPHKKKHSVSLNSQTFKLNNDGYKIFVGNVPYQCTQEEFNECFKNVAGFIKAEIITIHKTNVSRGFGFVTVKTFQNAENLRKRDDIVLKGRTLRFTSYQHENINTNSDNSNNYVYVDGIPDGKNKEWLLKAFSQYKPIGKCFIAVNHETGMQKNNGVIEFLDDNMYKNVLSKRVHEIDGKIIETTRYKNKFSPYANTNNNQQYYKNFNRV